LGNPQAIGRRRKALQFGDEGEDLQLGKGMSIYSFYDDQVLV
jgi:hypothetical protein